MHYNYETKDQATTMSAVSYFILLNQGDNLIKQQLFILRLKTAELFCWARGQRGESLEARGWMMSGGYMKSESSIK